MDKNSIYVKNYDDLKELYDWVRAYEPNLLYGFLLGNNEKAFGKKKDELIVSQMNIYRNKWEEIAMDETGPTMEHAIKYLMEHDGFSEEVAKVSAERIYADTQKTYNEVAKEVAVAIYSTDAKIRKALKWRCPLVIVRDFLRYQWGIKTRWYHKLFFKG